MASLCVAVLTALGASLTSLLAATASAAALFAHRRRPLIWVSAIIVVFDVVFYILVPLLALLVNFVLFTQGMGAAGVGELVMQVINTAVMVLWSCGLVAFWYWCFTLMKKGGREASDALDA